MDFKAQAPEKNKGFRAALLCVDIFSRFAYAEPLEGKTSEEVAAAFQRVLERVRTGRVGVSGRSGGPRKSRPTAGTNSRERSRSRFLA